MTTFSNKPPIHPGFYEVSAFVVEALGEGTYLFDPYWYGDDMEILSRVSFVGAVDPALTMEIPPGSYMKMTGLWDGEIFRARTAAVSTPWGQKDPDIRHLSPTDAAKIHEGIPDRLKEKISSYRTLYKTPDPQCEQVLLHIESYERSAELEEWFRKKNGILLTSVFTPFED